MIAEWIAMYGVSNSDYDNEPYGDFAPLEYILRYWDANKRTLYKMFGEQFVIERQISYARESAQLVLELRTAYERPDSALTIFREAIFRAFEQHHIDYFSNDYYRLRTLLTPNSLSTNRWSEAKKESFVFVDGDKKTSIEVYPNCKVIKVLQKLAKYFNLEEEFEAFRLQHSQILNQKAITGTLCLSIHPFDYITMSDNTYGWTSCMNWGDSGGYRAGTVEMMNSNSVIVAYIKGDTPFRVGKYLWEGNKKYRQLFIVDPQVICNVKAYPYRNDIITQITMDWLRELAIQNLQWDIPYGAQPIDECTFKYADGREYECIFDTNIMYNDFYSDNTKHYAIVPQGWQGGNADVITNITVNYSGENVCMWCGQDMDTREEYADHVLCSECDSGPRCEKCGRPLEPEDIYWVEGEPICSWCYDELADECMISNEYYFNDHLCTLYLTAIDDDLTDYKWLANVLVHLEYTEELGLRHEHYLFNVPEVRQYRENENDDPIFYVNISDCTRHCLSNIFGLWGNSVTAIERYIEKIIVKHYKPFDFNKKIVYNINVR